MPSSDIRTAAASCNCSDIRTARVACGTTPSVAMALIHSMDSDEELQVQTNEPEA